MLNVLYSILYSGIQEPTATATSYYAKARTAIGVSQTASQLLRCIVPEKSTVMTTYGITDDESYTKLMLCYICYLAAYTKYTCAQKELDTLDPHNSYWEPEAREYQALPLCKLFKLVSGSIDTCISFLDEDLRSSIKLGRTLLDKIAIVCVQLLRKTNG